jgi:hypothetical protein
MRYAVQITVPETKGMVFAPASGSFAASEYSRCIVADGNVRRLVEASSGQEVLLVIPDAAEIALRYDFTGRPSTCQEAIFYPAQSRYTAVADDPVAEATLLAGQGDPLGRAVRLARDVAKKFSHGHPERKFTDGYGQIPYPGCGLTQGSCVDIRTCLIASFRAAGIDAVCVTG